MRTLIPLSVILAVACAPLPGPSTPYRAAGTEPFWSLTVDARDVTFMLAGSEAVRQPAPKVIHGFAGEIYQTQRINVNIVHGPCSDGMSERAFPDKVQVTVDEHRFNGCGGL